VRRLVPDAHGISGLKYFTLQAATRNKMQHTLQPGFQCMFRCQQHTLSLTALAAIVADNKCDATRANNQA
jgi:hypothetical protein